MFLVQKPSELIITLHFVKERVKCLQILKRCDALKASCPMKVGLGDQRYKQKGHPLLLQLEDSNTSKKADIQSLRRDRLQARSANVTGISKVQSSTGHSSQTARKHLPAVQVHTSLGVSKSILQRSSEWRI